MDRHGILFGRDGVSPYAQASRVTIAGLAAKHNITRKCPGGQARGVSGFLALEWVFLISGTWPDLPTSSKA